MKADITWLDDPQVFRVNQMAAHSDHMFYCSREEMNQGKSSLMQSLNGTWKFHYSRNAMERPIHFYEVGFDDTYFDEIPVPGHIELYNYDKLHYINNMYPWEGHTYRRPYYGLSPDAQGEGLFSDATYNPVGSYRTVFDLDAGLLGKSVYIQFAGVEEAVYIWVNGEFVGYAEDSFTPSEFDLTPYLKETNNILAVEVHKRSAAAYLEDQDFFRFFGIFRDVTLYGVPDFHVADFWVKPILCEDNTSGSLEVEVKLSTISDSGEVHVSLYDATNTKVLHCKNAIQESLCFGPILLSNITPWDNHHPYLYTLVIELLDSNGELVEIVPYPIGFRRIELKDKLILLNGKRLIINGVNRHEWSATRGRAITQEEMNWDMQCFLRNNINAVRTSHYPNQVPWYYMCDTHGIYMMAETNLESHGTWQKMGPVEPSWNLPGSHPKWREIVLDRARTNFETFKNHTSILFWSLGNESYAEDNIEAMNTYYKQVDPSRLTHYEGVVHNRRYEDTISDVESRMYATPEEIVTYLESSPKKPFILCEYMHDMGNSLGGMKSYIDLLDQYDMYQGGFIWDYIDQALQVTDEITGQKVLRYGGDFDDRPSDYQFSGNGIVFANRIEKPAMQEVKYYYGQYK